MKGQPECGGIMANGQLQPPCERQPAKFVSKAVGKCSPGSFFDIGTWSCYVCPAGYNRNAKNISGDRACDKPVGAAQHITAEFLGKKQCPAGSFLDGRNGGECWSCPTGYGRTAAKVDAWNACGMVMKKAVNATFTGRACPEGSFTDPRNGGECWSCPEGFNRTTSAVTGNKACVKTLDFKPAEKTEALTCKAGDHFDFIDGGTCWSCPENYSRTSHGVKTNKACKTNEMKWVSPTRNMPGIFGLSPAIETIALELIRDRKEIDEAIIEGSKNIAGANTDEIAKIEWLLIENEPWNSEILSAVIAVKIVETARKPAGQRSALEKQLLSDIGKQIQWNRQFLASQMRQAFDNWTRTQAAELAERSTGNMTMFIGAINEPPDFNKIVGATLQATAMGTTLASGLSTGFLMKSFKFFAPYTRASKPVTVLLKIATPLGKVAVTGQRIASAAAGPAITAISTAITIAMELDKFIKIEATEGKIRQAEANSANPTDIAVLLQEKSGEEQFMFHWMALSNGETPPSADYAKAIAALQSGGVASTASAPVMPTITGGTSINAAEVALATASTALSNTLKKQVSQPAGSLRLEFSMAPGLCLTKRDGNSIALALGDCAADETPWVVPDTRTKELVIANDYCVGVEGKSVGPRTPVEIRKCSDLTHKTWALESRGQIRLVKGGMRMCLNIDDARPRKGSPVTLSACQVALLQSQLWKPWAPAS
ncbi:MAG: ricin-type beta-trefoil lectin domain protein [Pseudomonadota bacterium]